MANGSVPLVAGQVQLDVLSVVLLEEGRGPAREIVTCLAANVAQLLQRQRLRVTLQRWWVVNYENLRKFNEKFVFLLVVEFFKTNCILYVVSEDGLIVQS